MRHRQQAGYTLIELLVAVAVIGVLASISIFAFSSWRSRTAKTEVTNDLRNATSTIQHYQTFNNALPPDNATFATLYRASSNVTLTYALRGGGSSYCLKAQNTVVTTVVWYVDSATSSLEPSTTVCS